MEHREIPSESVTPELPTRTWRLVLAALGKLPQGALSRLTGRLADLPLPRPTRPLVLSAFARAFGIDVSEAERPLAEYGSIDAFFVRRLRDGVRTWPRDAHLATSPVDGFVGRVGRVTRGRALQAKGRDYSVAELLGDNLEGERYEGGIFVTLYLSPRHYHRVHTPMAGEIRRARHLPGALLPVNAAAVVHVADLFVQNERLLCYVQGGFGEVAVIAVGAYNVGRISAAFDAHWGTPGAGAVTNRPGAEVETRDYVPGIMVAPGAELMTFHLGSTVVLLFEPERLVLGAAVVPGAELRVGQELGRANVAR
ncbi:MAG: archaetidylserine decarboxylase [Longimicrobiales bacterium]